MTEEQEKLIIENHNLIYGFMQKFKLNYDDCYDIAAIGLCKAAIGYNESKMKFSTYAYVCMKNELLGVLRHTGCDRAIPNDKIVYYEEELQGSNIEDLRLKDVIAANLNVEDSSILHLQLQECIKGWSKKDKTVFILHLLGYTQREIAEYLNCSQTTVSSIKSKCISRLQKVKLDEGE